MNIANISTLNIPAENIGYPYYFILDNTLTISNLSVPDKGSPEVNYSVFKTCKGSLF
jgi:hypothetical protein